MEQPAGEPTGSPPLAVRDKLRAAHGTTEPAEVPLYALAGAA